MSLEGKADAKKLLRGRLEYIHVIYKDAYEVAVENGFEGTIDEWLETLKGEKGEPGKDGVSVTHEWEGTTLKVTSASGTSSADLKGEKGDKGEDGVTEAPYFDLIALGLPAVVPGGDSVYVDDIDLTEIVSAMDNGAIRIDFLLNVGAEVRTSAVVTPMGISAMGAYQFIVEGYMDGMMLTAVFELMPENREMRAFAVANALVLPNAEEASF